VLAARAAAEVVAGHQHAGALVLRPVQHEVASLAALCVEAQIVEQALGQPLALHRLQELLGDDLVSVDVGQRQRCDLGVEACEGLHHAASI